MEKLRHEEIILPFPKLNDPSPIAFGRSARW
jgi:hypothetical protein